MNDKEAVAAGVDWLRKIGETGDGIAPDVPPTDALEALTVWLAAKLASWDDQRDPQQPLPDTIVVPLKNPIAKTAGGGEMIRSITFTPPKWAQLKAMQRNLKGRTDEDRGIEMGDRAMVILNTCDLEQPDFDRLTAIDAQRCVDALSPFLSLRDR